VNSGNSRAFFLFSSANFSQPALEFGDFVPVIGDFKGEIVVFKSVFGVFKELFRGFKP